MANVKTETITRFQFRRGDTPSRESVVFTPGEPAWDTEQNTLYMGVPNVSGGQLCINLNSSEFDISNIAASGVSIDYQGFTSNFSQYLTVNPTSLATQIFNNIIIQGVASAVSNDPQLGASILVPATTTTLGGVIVGDGLSATDTGLLGLKLGPGLTISDDGNVVVPDLGAGFTTGPDGSIVVDTSSAAKNWYMVVNNTQPLSADDLSKTHSTSISKPGPAAKTVVNHHFASVIGAYLYGLRNLPPNCNLEIAVLTTNNDTETNWNHPIESSFIQSVSSTIYQAGSASEDDQWNIQLAFPAPPIDQRFTRYDQLKIFTTSNAGYLHRLIVSVDTGSYISIYNTLNIPLTSLMNSTAPGWSSPAILFWFGDNGGSNLLSGVIPTIEYDSGAGYNYTSSIIRFEGANYNLQDSGIEVRGPAAPYIERVYEGYSQSEIYILDSLYVSLTEYSSSTELFQGDGHALPWFQFYADDDERSDHKFIYKTSDIPLLSGWYHKDTISVQFAFLSTGSPSDLGIYKGVLTHNYPGIRMAGEVTFKSIHDTLTANDGWFDTYPLLTTGTGVTAVAVSGAEYSVEYDQIVTIPPINPPIATEEIRLFFHTYYFMTDPTFNIELATGRYLTNYNYTDNRVVREMLMAAIEEAGTLAVRTNILSAAPNYYFVGYDEDNLPNKVTLSKKLLPYTDNTGYYTMYTYETEAGGNVLHTLGFAPVTNPGTDTNIGFTNSVGSEPEGHWAYVDVEQKITDKIFDNILSYNTYTITTSTENWPKAPGEYYQYSGGVTVKTWPDITIYYNLGDDPRVFLID